MKRLLFAISLLTSSVFAWAVPALPGVKKALRLTDGTVVTAELKGDEFCHYWMADNGTAYIKEDNKDTYKAVCIDSLLQQGALRRSAANKNRIKRTSSIARVGNPTHYTGKKRGLIILIQFPDRPFTDSETANLRYQQIANEPNFSSSEGFTGSVYDYFKAQSRGEFELSFDVVGPYTSERRAKYYGQDYQGSQDVYVADLIAEACQQADAEVNFADYDWDGDGEADQVFVLYAGQGQAAGGDENTIWPHEGKLSAMGSSHQPITLDGIKIDTYACSCELGINKTIDGIGTICHEFAHCFGLPDMYDTQSNYGSEYRKYGMSYWDLMDYGNYNNNSFTPAGFTAYERMFCGWLQPKELTTDTTVTDMKALTDGGEAYLIRNDGHSDEYYILENRQLTSWDAGLPGKGLLIVHVDYNENRWTTNNVNTYQELCTVIRADNSDNHATNDRKEVAGDIYPYGANNSLTNTSVPAATVNNKNTDGSYLMNKSILNITQNTDGTMAFIFKNGIETGASVVKASDTANQQAIYTLGGQRLKNEPQSLSKGIYIIGGKKYIK